jgi:tetratricopeptide (TPR) repeat protein
VKRASHRSLHAGLLVTVALLTGCGHSAAADRGAASLADEEPRRPPSAQHDSPARLPSAEAYRAVLESEMALERGEPRSGAELLREALLHDPGSTWLRVRLGQVLLQLGDVEGARDEAAAALRKTPKHIDALRLLALTHALSGQRGEAKKALGRALAVRPGDRPASTMLAELLLEEGDVAAAGDVIERLMAKEPDAIDGYLSLARLFAERGELEPALHYVDKALARQERSVAALEVKVDLLGARGDFGAALPVATLLAKERGDSPRVMRLYLASLVLAGKEAQAYEVADNWLDDDKSEQKALLVASGFELSGQRARARQVLTDARGGAPSPRAQVEAGRLAFDEGRDSEAALLLCAAGEGESQAWRTYARSLCVRALARAGQGARARTEALAMLQQSPVAWRVLGALGWMLEHEVDGVGAEEVLELCDRATGAAPADVDVLDVCARAREAAGDPLGARALLEKALQGRPEDPALLMLLARFLERQGDAGAAVAVAERVLARAEQPGVDLLNFLAFTLADNGMRPGDAVGFAWRALVRGPLNGYVIDTLGWAQYRAGEARAALATLERANLLSPGEPEILHHLGEVHRSLGERDAARRRLLEARESPATDAKLRAKIDAALLELREAS